MSATTKASFENKELYQFVPITVMLQDIRYSSQ